MLKIFTYQLLARSAWQGSLICQRRSYERVCHRNQSLGISYRLASSEHDPKWLAEQSRFLPNLFGILSSTGTPLKFDTKIMIIKLSKWSNKLCKKVSFKWLVYPCTNGLLLYIIIYYCNWIFIVTMFRKGEKTVCFQ